MNDLLIVALFSLIGGAFSLIGGILLIAHKRAARDLIKYVTPFAAGALLAAAFTDILIDASEQGTPETALRWTMIGIVTFFLVERFLRWFHHHHADENEKTDATVPLIIVGDTIHNFLDGVAIAAAFLIDVPTGIITTLAVAAHEIPQEIGDFGLLLDKGMSRAGALKVNIMSSLATTIAAVGFYQLGHKFELSLAIPLGMVAGFLIYIAVSDIIPSIHETEDRKLAGAQTIMLIIGVVVVSLTTSYFHRYIEVDHQHENTTSSVSGG